MLTPYINGTLLAVVGSLAVATLLAQSPSAQSPSAHGQVGGSAQAPAHGAVDAGHAGAAAQGSGSGSAEAAAHAGDDGAQLADGSSVNAVLTKPLGLSKPGDPISARTTQPARTSDGTSIPEGSRLVGHVSEVHARGEGEASSALGVVFDRAVTRDGREIPLRNVGIRALAAAEGAVSGSAGASGMMTGAGSRSGGGLLGRTNGAVGGTVGGSLGAARGVTGSLTGSAGGALEAGPGAIGGVDASGSLSAGSSGVFGLRDLSLAGSGSSTSQGSLLASTGKSVRLDQGTRLLLASQPERAKVSAPNGSQPDKR